MPSGQRLVLAALAFNAALLVLAAIVGETRDVLYVLILGAPPVLLLALGRHPRLFRVLAGLLGFVYVAWTAVTFFVGGVLFAPTGLLLLAAACCSCGSPHRGTPGSSQERNPKWAQ